MFWKNWSWPKRILSGVGLGLVAAILSPLFARSRELGKRSSCQSNLKQIGLGFAQYTQDYNEYFPLVASGGSAFGWADALQPYLKSTQIFQCQQELTPGQLNPRESGYIDYPFNVRMSGKPLAEIANVQAQVLLLDGNGDEDQTDARYALSEIPLEWRQNNSSPLFRHNGVANYLFADGRVKSLLPLQVENANQPVF